RTERDEAPAPLALATTAHAIREARVFRGRNPIRNALRRLANPPADSPRADQRRQEQRAARARLALPVFEQLVSLVESIDRSGPWRDQVHRLRRLAAALRVGEPAYPGDANGPHRAGLD